MGMLIIFAGWTFGPYADRHVYTVYTDNTLYQAYIRKGWFRHLHSNCHAHAHADFVTAARVSCCTGGMGYLLRAVLLTDMTC